MQRPSPLSVRVHPREHGDRLAGIWSGCKEITVLLLSVAFIGLFTTEAGRHEWLSWVMAPCGDWTPTLHTCLIYAAVCCATCTLIGLYRGDPPPRVTTPPQADVLVRGRRRTQERAQEGDQSGGRRRRRPPHSFPGCARRDRPRRSAADPSDTALQPDSPTAPDSNERFQHFCVTMRHRTADTSPSVLREATTYIDDKAGTVGCASS